MTDPTNPYAAPTADWAAPRAVRLSWSEILFSFEGRLPRRFYWATRGISFVMLFVVAFSAGMIDNKVLTLVLLVPAYIGFLWIVLAGSVKRWHDLNKSGWWIFIAMVPVIGGFWELVEAGCMRGTHGPNRYGHDPT